MITTFNNPYRMGGYEGCGPDWNAHLRANPCPCRALPRDRTSGPTLGGLAGVIDELGPVPKLAIGIAMLAGAVVIFQAVDKAKG